MDRETIVARATPAGRSAIAIVRMSGPDTFKIIQHLISAKTLDTLKPKTAVLAKLYRDCASPDLANYIDSCLLLPFIGPNSYTGEDLLEIFCHGGNVVWRVLFETLIQYGARPAEPGEFTRRAFLNGKMDLIEAEAVEGIVSAATQTELQFAMQHASGQFSRELKELRAEMLDLASLIELELDFSEEDVEFADRTQLQSRLQSIKQLLDTLCHSYNRAQLVREGMRVAIVGKPNVGKSSLLNLLLKQERAIVTEHPGTTRDVIEEAVEIGGQKFVFIDTAGIRDSDDLVEQEGVRRSRAVVEQAAAVLFLVDCSRALQRDDWEIRQVILGKDPRRRGNCVIVRNKSDLPAAINREELDIFQRGFTAIDFSCVQRPPIPVLEQKLLAIASGYFGETAPDEPAVVNLRQKERVASALAAVENAIANLQNNLSQEFIASELRIALDCLGDLIGEVTTEDVLGHIFSNFCIGK